MEKDIRNKIKYLIDKKKSPDEICKIMNMDLTELYNAVLELRETGRPYAIIDGVPIRIKNNDINYYKIDSSSDEICVVSDLHLGSNYDRVDILRKIYDDCSKRSIDTILCAGDVTDGYYEARPRYCNTQRVLGYDDMLHYVASSLPFAKNIKMYAISGNHDDTFETGECKSILAALEARRKDFIYLGRGGSRVSFNGSKIKIIHGYSNFTNMDDRLEGFYETLPVINKPDILIAGHIHTSAYKQIEDTKILQCASLMDNPSYTNKIYEDEKSCYYVRFIYDDNGNIIDTEIEQDFFEDQVIRKRVK